MLESGARCLPLLPLQQGMVLTLFANPHAGVDVQQCIVRVREPLDEARFRRAWQCVMDRHDGLRTHFLMRGVECFQQVNERGEAQVFVTDWRNLSPTERDQRLETFLSEDRTRGFDLWNCPVWRVTAFDCAEQGVVFVLSHPHAIVDAQSAFIVLRDFFAFYSDPASRLEPPGTLATYMHWYARRDAAGAAACWREVFQGFESASPLLLPGSADDSPGLADVETTLDAPLGARIRDVCEREKLPLSAVVKAVWAIMLGRLSSCDDVVFGEVRSGRRKDVPDMQTSVGMFVATVPVRVSVKSGQTFRALVQQLRDLQGKVREYEHTALHDIQKWCGLGSSVPLLESALVYDHVSFNELLRLESDAWRDREISYREHTAVPITLNITALPQIVIKVSWDRSRYSAASMQRLPGYFRNLLEAFARDPDCVLSNMDMLGHEERERLLVHWNATVKAFDQSTTLTAAFEQSARRHPEHTAVSCGAVSLTYRQLDKAVARASADMRRLGVTRGSRVGICVDRSIGMLVAMLATMKAGAAYVPLDPAFPDDRLRFMVSDAEPALIVVTARHANRFAASGVRTLQIDESPANPSLVREAPELVNAETDAVRSEATDTAYVIYTSGSTGWPKGVMVSHRNVMNCFAGMDDVLEPQSAAPGRWLAVTSISFDISVIELLWTLTRGFGITLSRDSADPTEIVELLRSRDITHLQCTPALARMLVAVPGGVDLLRRLQTLMLGGEPLAPDLFATLGRTVVNVYGPTETAIWSTAARLCTHDIHIGRPIANTKLYVLDTNRLPVPTGVAGELYIGGLGVAKGYLNRPELNAERFVRDPFDESSGAARMYRTGDLVRYREDGRLEYLERIDNQVKIRGHRIEIGEIEAAMRAIPEVADAAVLASKDGAGEKRLIAFFTRAPGNADVDHEQLRAQLAKSLPNYEIPARFMVLPKLPLTPNLKVDRKALAQLEGGEDLAGNRAIVAPRNDAERVIAGVWQEVLGIGRVGVTDNFFSLGGDSLRAVQVALSVRAILGVEIPANALHQHPTIEALAASCSGGRTDAGEDWATWETLGSVATHPPIIGVHGVDRIFLELAKNLGLRMDVITSRVGFDGAVPPYHPAKSVEDMAERYLAAIRARYPHGPYTLMGFCLGGLIATDIARRMIASGEKVEFLGLFNSPPSPPPVEDFRQRLARHKSAIGAMGAAKAIQYAASHSLGYVAHAFRAVRRYRPAFLRKPAPHATALDQAEEARRRVVAFGLRMATEHHYPPYAGHVHLFYGAHWPADYLERWAAIAQKGVSGSLLPGGHLDMMEEPHVRIVARRVLECLPGVTSVAPEPRMTASR